MNHPFAPKDLQALVAAVNPRWLCIGVKPLEGGIAMQATQITVRDGSEERHWVLRRASGRSESQRTAIAREQTLLAALASTSLPSPRPIACNPEGTPLDVPWILLEYLPGSTRTTPPRSSTAWSAMAQTLRAVHAVPPAVFAEVGLPSQERLLQDLLAQPTGRTLDQDLQEAVVRETVHRWSQENRPPSGHLLHGDFWPGNLLWQGDELVGILDWEDALVGDVGLDVAITRLDALLAFGPGSARAIAEAYWPGAFDPAAQAPWDLVAALRPMGQLGLWAGNAEREVLWRGRLRGFIQRALGRMGGA